MRRDSSKSQDLLESFRKLHKQIAVPEQKPKKKGKARSGNATSYEKFMEKYLDLENNIGTFKPLDLLFFFREKAGEADIKYIISNQARDCGVFKNLLKKFTSEEICLMIEFLFNSEQTYLDKTRIQPTVLISGWCNTIYQDSLLWLDDKFVNKPKHNKPSREFNKNENDTTSLGGWE